MLTAVLVLATQEGLDNTVDPTAYSGLNTVQVASLLVGVFIPILVGLVTKRVTAASTKALLLAGLSAVSGFFTEYINSANFHWQQALLTTIVTFVIAVATHYGLWVPTGVTAKAQATLVHDDQNGVLTVRNAVTVLVAVIVVLVLIAVLT